MKKILVIGEECRDIFIYGDVKRLCPEAPCPIFTEKYKKENKGMAANVFQNIKKISQSQYLKNKFELYSLFSSIQPVKTRYVDESSGYILLRVDGNDKVEKNNVVQGSCLLHYDVVVVSDYNKGFLSEDDLVYIASNSKYSILDSKKILSKRVFDKFSLIKMNEKEFNNNISLAKGRDNVIVTLGAAGMFYKNINYHVKPVAIRDVSGCGDTALAALSVKIADGDTIENAIYYANLMASAVASKRGVSTPDID